jgi:hypothetical protein
MLNCEQATRLLSEQEDRALGVGERTRLRMHTWVCESCRNFGGQLGFIRRAVKGFASRPDEGQPERDDPPV